MSGTIFVCQTYIAPVVFLESGVLLHQLERSQSGLKAPDFPHLRRPAKVSSESRDEGCVLRAAEAAGGEPTEREAR